jgi:hypothetical protein
MFRFAPGLKAELYGVEAPTLSRWAFHSGEQTKNIFAITLGLMINTYQSLETSVQKSGCGPSG